MLVSLFFSFAAEVRTHGVGYYAFSQEEEKRSEQLNLLNKLRDQVGTQIFTVRRKIMPAAQKFTANYACHSKCLQPDITLCLSLKTFTVRRKITPAAQKVLQTDVKLHPLPQCSRLGICFVALITCVRMSAPNTDCNSKGEEGKVAGKEKSTNGRSIGKGATEKAT